MEISFFSIPISNRSYPVPMRICLFITIFLLQFLPAQESEKNILSNEVLYDMSLEELMNIRINVSSTEEMDIFHTPSTVTVLDRELLELYNFQSVAEAIEIVAGMEVYQTIIDRNVATVRGIHQNFYANKILLLIDKIPTWQPIYGDGHLERININDVERIEILKGPASVLYGSNAFTGVINIVLKQSSETSIQGHGGFGFPNVGNAGIIYSDNLGDFNFTLSASSSDEKRAGYMVSARSDTFLYRGNSKFFLEEEYNNGNFNLRGSYGDHELFFNTFYFRHTFLGAHPSYAGGGGNFVDNKGSLINYRLNKKISENINLEANVGYDYFQRAFPLSADRVNEIYLAGDRIFSDAVSSYKINDVYRIETGIAAELRRSYGHDTRDALTDTLVRHNLIQDDDAIEWSTFAQLEAIYDYVDILVGSRYTHNDQFGSNISSRISAVINISDDQAFKLIVGQAFRVPTMFELYFNHPTVTGNRDLKPELTNSAEIAYLAGFENLFFQALMYYATYDDFIQRFEMDSLPPQYNNAEDFETIGLEVEIKYQLPKVINAYLNYNYLDGADNDEKEQFRFVPKHSVSFGINRQFGIYFVALKGKRIGEVDGPFKIIQSQSLFDLNIGFTNKVENIEIRNMISIKNIFDSDWLIPEYIRKVPNVNSIAATAFGRTFLYTLYFSF